MNIKAGIIDTGIAGGADVMSQGPISLNKKMTEAMVKSTYGRGSKLKAFKGIGLKDIIPAAPSIKEPSSDYTMGQAAEKMAKENGISLLGELAIDPAIAKGGDSGEPYCLTAPDSNMAKSYSQSSGAS